MKKIFLIPHGSDPNLKVRGLELATALSQRPEYEVYCLEFARNFSLRRSDILRFFVFNIFRPIRFQRVQELTIVTFPFLFLPLSSTTIRVVRWFANAQVQRIIQRMKPDIIINESHFCISVPRSSNYHLIYDLVDDHLPGSLEGWMGSIISEFTLRQLTLAESLWTISHTLIKKLQIAGFPNVQYVPNGTWLRPFTHVNEKKVSDLRTVLNPDNKYLIGYIGNHASWSGIDFVLEIAQQAPPDWLFLVVGGGTEIERLGHSLPQNVKFTGPVAREKIVEYFSVLDVGILPFIKNDLTDAALQLKIIEYGAAKKITIAQSLSELETLQLPHVFFPTERSVEAWIKQLTVARQQNWNSSWSDRISEYDWQRIVERISWETS